MRPIDTLMGPKLDTLGPFLLEPEIPSASFRRQAGPVTGGVLEALASGQARDMKVRWRRAQEKGW